MFLYCAIHVGSTEVSRTRAIKFTPKLVWERPEERFRVPMKKIEAASVAAQNPHSSSGAVAPSAQVPDLQNGDANRSELATDRATSSVTESADVAIAGYGDIRDEEQKRNATKTKTANKNMAGGGDETTTSHPVPSAVGVTSQQRQKQTSYSSLTLQLWGKRAIGGNRRDLLGTAIVPTQDIEHPPGDIWLPLGNNIIPAPDTVIAPNVSRRGRDSTTWDEGKGFEGADDALQGKTSEPVASATSVGDDKGKGNSAMWGSGLLKAFSRSKGLARQASNVGLAHFPTGSVHVWLGKVRGGSSRGREPGRGRVVLRIHAAAGLRKVNSSWGSIPNGKPDFLFVFSHRSVVYRSVSMAQFYAWFSMHPLYTSSPFGTIPGTCHYVFDSANHQHFTLA